MDGESDFFDVSVAQDGGVLKKILTEGVGEKSPPNGNEVEAHYTGTISPLLFFPVLQI